MNEDKATRYHRLGRRSSLLSTAWMLALLVAAVLTGASAGLRDAAASVGSARWDSVVVALYVLAMSLALDVATLPFAFYKGYLLERRYGLATETVGHWLKDHLKAVGIGLVFGEAGAIFVYYTIR